MSRARDVAASVLVGATMGTLAWVTSPAAPASLHCGCGAVSCARPCVPNGGGCCPDAQPTGCPMQNPTASVGYALDPDPAEIRTPGTR